MRFGFHVHHHETFASSEILGTQCLTFVTCVCFDGQTISFFGIKFARTHVSGHCTLCHFYFLLMWFFFVKLMDI